MARIPESLQPPKRSLTISQERKVEKYGSLEEAKNQEIKKQVEEIQERLSNISYEDYTKEYNKIDSGLKKYFISPEELFKTPEYLDYKNKKSEYEKQQAEYEKQVRYQQAYESVLRHYKKGMLWAIAAYGEGLEQDIAKRLIKEGYSPALGGKLDQERRAKQLELIKTRQELGIKPIYRNGELVGYEDKKLGKSYSADILPEVFQKHRKTDLPKLEKLGYIEVKEQKNEEKIISGIISLPPTISERYKQQTKEKGYVKGTLGFAGNEVSRLYSQYVREQSQQGNAEAYYQKRAIQNLLSTGVSTAPYFTPAGPAILFLGGAEELITPSGRKRIYERKEYLIEEKEYNPFIATTISYGQPVLEAGIGGYGLYSQYTGLQVSQEQKLFEESKQQVIGLRAEDGDKGVDLLIGYRKTQPTFFQRNILRIKPTEYTTYVKQPFYKVGETSKVIFEGGEGITYQLSGNKLTTTTFDIAGRGYGDKQALLGKEVLRVGTENLQGSIGRNIINTRVQSTGRINRGFNPITGEYYVRYSGSARPIKSYNAISSQAVSIESGENIIFAGGKASKFRIYPEKITSIGKVESAGVIRRIQLPSSGGESITTGKLISKTVTKSKFAPYVPEVITAQKATTKTLSLPTINTKRNIISGQPTLQKPEQKTKQFELLKSQERTRQKEETRQEIRLLQKPEQRTRNISASILSSGILEIQKENQQVVPRISSLQIIFPEEAQRMKGLNSSYLYNSQLTPTPETPTTINPPIFPIGFIRRKPGQAREGIGYNVFVKDKGKFRKINRKPNTESSALSQGARVVDNTTARTFKIQPITISQKGKKVPKRFSERELERGDSYFGLNRNKFREYKISKGQKIVTPRRFIEKRSNIIDTPGEKRGLSVARFISRRNKNIRRTPFGF